MADSDQPSAPAWQRRLRRSLPFRVGQRGYVAVLHRLFDRRSTPLPALDGTGHASGPPCTLVVAPHPDDETLGCGALMRRRVGEGGAVTVVVVTDGRHSHVSDRITPDELAAHRRRESIEACASLGVTDVRFLDFEEGTLDARATELAERLTAIVAELGPAEAYLPSHRDGHVDHRVLNRVGRQVLAARPATAVREYPIWFWDAASWVQPGSPPWRKALDVLRGPLRAVRTWDIERVELGPHRAAKQRAIAAYRSQTTNLVGDEGWATFDRRFLDNFDRFDELFFSERRR